MRQRAAGLARTAAKDAETGQFAVADQLPADLPEAGDKPTRKPKTERKKNESAEKAAVADQVVANLPQAGTDQAPKKIARRPRRSRGYQRRVHTRGVKLRQDANLRLEVVSTLAQG